MAKNCKVYRMHLKSKVKEGFNSFGFCLKNEIVGTGWGLNDENKILKTITDLEEYERLGRLEYSGDPEYINTVNVYKKLKNDDLIWVRNEGVYYLCRIIGPWFYNGGEENINHDIYSGFPVEVLKVGTIDKVPGAIVNNFMISRTIQPTLNDHAISSSKSIYNTIIGFNYYNSDEKRKEGIFSLLLAEDVEEIISLYLQLKKDYLIYSSTNKIDTPKYEFVGISKDGKYKIYPQVKTGSTTLNYNDFDHLTENGNKVYLFSTNDQYITNENKNIIALGVTEITEFVYSNQHIMPDRIKQWL